MDETMRAKRLLTGDRPTGRLHLGHLVGSLRARVAMQHTHDAMLLVADLHTLTTQRSPEQIDGLAARARGLVVDYLAAGIDPEQVTVYLQSAVPEVYELAALLGNLVTVERLSRLPTLKAMLGHAGEEAMPYGLLGYPTLQAADVLMMKAEVVPVGPDNAAHLEVTREIARRFNQTYGEVFPVPEVVLGGAAPIPGTDGKGKMSKSAGNAIFLSDDAACVRRKVRRMYTDPNRVHAHIPGTVEGNPVFALLRAFHRDPAALAALEARYRAGTVGDVEVKDRLVGALEATLAPMRARRAALEAQRGLVDRILVEGTEYARGIARQTLREARRAMGVDRAYVRIRRAAERAGR